MRLVCRYTINDQIKYVGPPAPASHKSTLEQLARYYNGQYKHLKWKVEDLQDVKKPDSVGGQSPDASEVLEKPE